MATHSPGLRGATRALRVGVILGGNLVEERLFRLTRELPPITVGQSLRATLSIPVDGVPIEHALFARDTQGRLVLRVTERITGRLATGTAIESELHHGTPTEGVWSIPVEPGTRGRLQLGEATLLFQEVAAPPIAPRPQLPASVRGTLVDRVDRRLAVVIAGSLLLHLGLATWASLTERERDEVAFADEGTYEPPQYGVMELPAEMIDPGPVVEPGPGEPIPGDPAPAVAAPANPGRQTPRPMTPRVDQLPGADDPDRWARLMTGNTTGPDGGSEISSRIPGDALDQQIRDIRDHGREVRVGNDPRSRPSAPTRIGTGPDGPGIEDPQRTTQVAKDERPPTIRITPIKDPTFEPGLTLTPAMVIARIQGSYLAGLQRCYAKHGLSVDANLVARVTVRFVVDDKGRATENQARGANDAVDTCIAGQMALWRFPVPKDKDGDPTEAPFQVILALQPAS